MIRRILFIGDYPNAIEKNLNIFFQNLIYQIADEGVECTVIAPVSITKYRKNINQIPYYREECTKNNHIVKVYSPKFVSYSCKRFGKIDTHVWTIKALRRSALRVVEKERLSFDATYGHFINIGGIPACKIGKKYGVPAFIANGESDLNPDTYRFGSRYDLDSIKDCTAVISVSTKNKDELVATGLVNEEKIKVFPNAIDNSSFYKMDKVVCREKLGFDQDAFLVGFVGGFSERKGDKRVARATEGIDVSVAFCGGGKEKPQGDQIVFCDSVKHENLPVYLNAFDVFVLPTTNEGCCNAIVEAMACGLPVISSDKSFNYDILSSDTALLVNPMDIDAIRASILSIKENKQLAEKLSQASLDRAQDLTINVRAKNILRYMNSYENKID